MRLRSMGIIAFVGVVALFGACFHSLYNDPDACSLDPPVVCADPARPNCFLGRCFADGDLPDGAVPADFSGITMDAAITCNGSAECPDDAPVCQAAKCRGCIDNKDDNQCTIHSAATPRCNTANGQCVECLVSSDCGTSKPICGTDLTCRKCTANAECTTTLICKSDGTCATPSEVAVVDNTKVSCSDSTGMPYCTIQAAANSNKPYVSVAGSPTKYAAVTLGTLSTNVNVTIVGPGRDAMPPASIEQSGVPAISVTSTATFTTNVTIDGMTLTGSNGGTKKAGLLCSVLAGTTPSLTVKNSHIFGSGGYGLDSSQCSLVADANLIGPNNTGGGINVAQSPALFTITNNIVFENGTGGRGVTLDDTSTGTFAFNTVVKNNNAAGIGGIECGAGVTKPIIGSIVVLNTGGNGSQVGAQCALAATVTTMTPTFAGTSDYHLVKNDAANLACCVDKITPTANAAVDHDVDVGHRPQGQSWDVGAHEVQ